MLGLVGAEPAGAHTGPGFRVECRYSHSANDDAIVHPGAPGASHLHDFFGNETTDAYSDYESLRAGSTTCKDEADASAYWAPALFQNGERIEARSVTLYYTPNGKDYATIEPFPVDLRMIAGGTHHTHEPLDEDIVRFGCSGSLGLPGSPPTCPSGTSFTIRIKFPDCWDGVLPTEGGPVDSADHRSHMAYALPLRENTERTCPDSHPIPMEQLNLTISYPVPTGKTVGGAGVSLASGSIYTSHADFMNAWDQTVLEDKVERCTNQGPLRLLC